jgi:hypothetical protein
MAEREGVNEGVRRSLAIGSLPVLVERRGMNRFGTPQAWPRANAPSITVGA